MNKFFAYLSQYRSPILERKLSMDISAILLTVLIVPALRAQDTIPFFLTDQNNIAVSAILNGSDTIDLMLHTAVSEVSITEETIRHLSRMDSTQAVTAKSWGGENEARYVSNQSLSIGTHQWDSLTVWIGQLSGPGTQGKFGPNLFREKVIELNYDQEWVIIHSDLSTIGRLSEYTKSHIQIARGIMYIEGDLHIGDELIRHQFMIHSGYGGSLLLDDQFATDHDLGNKLETISEKKLRDAYGNEIKTKEAILPGLRIGTTAFSDLQIGFFEGKLGTQQRSVLGNAILTNFHIILDMTNAHIYLKRRVDY